MAKKVANKPEVEKKEVSYVKFTRKDSAMGFKFNEGEVFKATEIDKGMTLIGSAWVWNTSLAKATEEEYKAYVSAHGARIVSNARIEKKGRVKKEKVIKNETFDGKVLTEVKATDKFAYYAVDGGNVPRTLTEAKKMLKIGLNEEFTIKFYKDDKFSFAVKKLGK